MKRKLLFFVFIIIGLLGKAQNKFGLSHGPYLQEVTNNGATFVFLTSNNSFSSVELKHIDSNESKLYHHTQHGLKDAYDTFYAIRVEQLQSGVTYQYRIHSKEIRSFEPYKVVYGDSITTQWYTFKTVDLKSKGGSIFITSDTHDDAKRLEKFLELCDYKTCDAFFYGGDVMSYIPTKETPFSSFIDSSVKMFATSIPFELVRGNHETRGKLARFFPELFPKKDGKIYGSYDNGNTVILCQIAVAQFANASGLEKIGDDCYQSTLNSGEFDGIGVEISADGGSISSGELEMSNVDLSSQFTDMIVTQRGFQANSRVITTSDTLLEELINLKR